MSGRRGDLLIEEFVEGGGFVAVWACAAVADAGHEGGAVVAALLAEATRRAVAGS